MSSAKRDPQMPSFAFHAQAIGLSASGLGYVRPTFQVAIIDLFRSRSAGPFTS